MKKIILTFTALLVAVFASAQSTAVDELFDKYAEREGFTVVTISSRMFSLIARLDSENQNPDGIMKNLKSIRILTVSDSLLNKNINFYNELRKKTDLSVYEELMAVKEAGDVTKFLIRENGDRITELLVIAGGPNGNSLISIRGNLSLKNISELSKSMDMEELEGLENIDNNKKE